MRLSHATQRVLREMLEAPKDPRYGLELIRATGMPSGSLYPILGRLEKKGLVTSEWEKIDPTVEGRPRRRLYRLTADGIAVAQCALERTARELGFLPMLDILRRLGFRWGGQPT